MNAPRRGSSNPVRPACVACVPSKRPPEKILSRLMALFPHARRCLTGLNPLFDIAADNLKILDFHGCAINSEPVIYRLSGSRCLVTVFVPDTIHDAKNMTP